MKNTSIKNITEVFNIGNQEEEISIKDLVNILLYITNRNDLKILPNVDTQGSPSRRCPDMSKTISVSNISPNTNTKEGCIKTWDWYKRNL